MNEYTQQLEQIQSLLESDPHNEELLDLKKDLLELLELLDGEGESGQKPAGARVELNWKAGDACQVKGEGGSQSESGTIVSLSADQSMATIHLKGDGALLPNRMVTVSCQRLQKAPEAKAQRQLYGMPSEKSKRNLKAQLAVKLKRQRQKEKFFGKQEAVATAKQNDWRSFQQRISKPAASSSFSYSKRPTGGPQQARQKNHFPPPADSSVDSD